MKRWLRIVLQLVSLVLFVLIVWWAGPEAWQGVWQGDQRALLIALALYGVAGVASATRLRLMTHSIHRQNTASWRRYHQANWVARAFGLVLPRTLSTIGGKSVALRSFDVPLKRSLWIVLVDNLFDVFLLILVCVPAFFFLRGDLQNGMFVIAVGLVVLLGGTAVWWITSAQWTRRLTKWVRHVPWLAHKLNLENEQDLILLPQSGAAVQSVGWAIMLNLTLVFGFYYMAQAVGMQADWLLFLAAYPFVQLSLVAAVTPGGLGLFELGWLGLLTLGGVAEDEALTFVVAQRVYVTVFVLLWTGVSILLAFTEKTAATQYLD